MGQRFIAWIWHIRGSVALPPGQSGDEALDRLDPLFRQAGTSHDRTGDTLTFRKRDQAAQDKMSVFDSGSLRIEDGAGGRVLRYDLVSRALLLCFLAPLLFLGVAQLTVALVRLEAPAVEDAKKAKEAQKKLAALPMNPIDKALGAPAPKKPDKKDDDKPAGRGKKPTPTAAYVFAAIFAVLYVAGRILEDRLAKRLFRRSLFGS